MTSLVSSLDRSAPRHVVTGRPGVGLTSTLPWRVVVPAGEGEHRVGLPDVLTGDLVQDGVELHWAVLPVGLPTAAGNVLDLPDLEDLWAGTAVAVDLVLDGGTRLSDVGGLDQYGTAVTPAAQAAARRTWVDQWNLRRVDLAAFVGRRVEAVEVRVQRHRRREIEVFVDAVRLVTAAPAADVVDLVRTTRGSFSTYAFSRGNTLPFVGVPHGCLYATPLTDADTSMWMYSWQSGREGDPRPVLQAVATSHAPSPWIGERGAVQVMPSLTGEVDRARRGLAFDHDDEVDRPHVWSASLEGGIEVEVTAGPSVMAVRSTFPTTAQRAFVVLDHLGEMDAVEIRQEGTDWVVTGVLSDHAPTPSARPPAHHVHVRIPGSSEHTLAVDDAGRLSGAVEVDPSAPVTVLVGLSTLDAQTAAAHVAAVTSFDDLRAAAARQWEPLLQTITVEGASEQVRRDLASNLYRLFLFPTRQDEPIGGGRTRWRTPYSRQQPWRAPEIEDRPATGSGWYAATNGFWDTYRTAWPLLGLLTPQDAGAAAQGFLEHFTDSGWVPRWSAPGPEDCMTGTTSDTVFADMVAYGVPGLDLRQAWHSALVHASVPSTDPRVGRTGLHPALFRRYVSTSVVEGMSWTLDNALNDWSASRLGRALAAELPDGAERTQIEAECEWLERRSLHYREVFNTVEGYFIGRDDDGAWRVSGSAFDPDRWGEDYTETNAWGTAVTVPHDGAGLASLYGGEDALGAAIDALLARPETGAARYRGSYDDVIHEMTEARDCRMGMLALSNQPAHHIPFMYMHAGRHDDAHAVVTDALDRLFVGSDLGQGYPGDEDNGEMSAWWVFATIGLYPLVPGSGTFVLTPPRVPRTVLRPVGGAEIEIVTRGSGRYIEAVTIDGEPWHEISVPHARLVRGARIEVTLSERPQGWAARSRPVSASAIHGHTEPLVDLSGTGSCSHPGLVDDTGSDVIEVSSAVEISWAEPTRLGDLMTVTIAGTGTIGWRLLAQTDHGWQEVDDRAHEEFARADQTRVFRLPRAIGSVRRVRFVPYGPTMLRQLEIFAP